MSFFGRLYSGVQRMGLSTTRNPMTFVPCFNYVTKTTPRASLQDQTSTVGDEKVTNPDSMDDEHVKDEILNVALNYVNVKGWNVDAIATAAEELRLASSVSQLFKDYDLVNYFVMKSNQELEIYLSENETNLREAVEWRLKKVVPYSKGYSEALALITQPENVQQSMKLLLELADSIAHHSLKDTSTNINWYSRRVGIAALYATSEMCLIQDTSEGHAETWKFVDRRAKEYEKLDKGELSLGSLPLPELLSVGFTTLRNILGKNAPR